MIKSSPKLRALRKPRGYDGAELTCRQLSDLLPDLMSGIGRMHKERPDLILAAWPDVIGSKLAPMTRAFSFETGTLTVLVKNSTLYSLLSQHEKPKLLKKLREKFPSATIQNIVFRIG